MYDMTTAAAAAAAVGMMDAWFIGQLQRCVVAFRLLTAKTLLAVLVRNVSVARTVTMAFHLAMTVQSAIHAWHCAPI